MDQSKTLNSILHFYVVYLLTCSSICVYFLFQLRKKMKNTLFVDKKIVDMINVCNFLFRGLLVLILLQLIFLSIMMIFRLSIITKSLFFVMCNVLLCVVGFIVFYYEKQLRELGITKSINMIEQYLILGMSGVGFLFVFLILTLYLIKSRNELECLKLRDYFENLNKNLDSENSILNTEQFKNLKLNILRVQNNCPSNVKDQINKCFLKYIGDETLRDEKNEINQNEVVTDDEKKLLNIDDYFQFFKEDKDLNEFNRFIKQYVYYLKFLEEKEKLYIIVLPFFNEISEKINETIEENKKTFVSEFLKVLNKDEDLLKSKIKVAFTNEEKKKEYEILRNFIFNLKQNMTADVSGFQNLKNIKNIKASINLEIQNFLNSYRGKLNEILEDKTVLRIFIFLLMYTNMDTNKEFLNELKGISESSERLL